MNPRFLQASVDGTWGCRPEDCHGEVHRTAKPEVSAVSAVCRGPQGGYGGEGAEEVSSENFVYSFVSVNFFNMHG